MRTFGKSPEEERRKKFLAEESWKKYLAEERWQKFLAEERWSWVSPKNKKKIAENLRDVFDYINNDVETSFPSANFEAYNLRHKKAYRRDRLRDLAFDIAKPLAKEINRLRISKVDLKFELAAYWKQGLNDKQVLMVEKIIVLYALLLIYLEVGRIFKAAWLHLREAKTIDEIFAGCGIMWGFKKGKFWRFLRAGMPHTWQN